MSQRASEPLTPEQFEELLALSAERLGFSTHASWTQIARYLSALTRWRRSMNLTGELSPQELTEHALESVLGANLIIHGARVIDIGSGAGFPGLPIATARADVKMSLLEPRGKRAAFLRYVVRDLRLSNTQILEKRVEEVGGQTFDVATMRAVGSPRGLENSGLFRPGAAFIAWTTTAADLDNALAPGFVLERSLHIPGSRQREIRLYRFQ